MSPLGNVVGLLVANFKHGSVFFSSSPGIGDRKPIIIIIAVIFLNV